MVAVEQFIVITEANGLVMKSSNWMKIPNIIKPTGWISHQIDKGSNKLIDDNSFLSKADGNFKGILPLKKKNRRIAWEKKTFKFTIEKTIYIRALGFKTTLLKIFRQYYEWLQPTGQKHWQNSGGQSFYFKSLPIGGLGDIFQSASRFCLHLSPLAGTRSSVKFPFFKWITTPDTATNPKPSLNARR